MATRTIRTHGHTDTACTHTAAHMHRTGYTTRTGAERYVARTDTDGRTYAIQTATDGTYAVWCMPVGEHLIAVDYATRYTTRYGVAITDVDADHAYIGTADGMGYGRPTTPTYGAPTVPATADTPTYDADRTGDARTNVHTRAHAAGMHHTDAPTDTVAPSNDDTYDRDDSMFGHEHHDTDTDDMFTYEPMVAMGTDMDTVAIGTDRAPARIVATYPNPLAAMAYIASVCAYVVPRTAGDTIYHVPADADGNTYAYDTNGRAYDVWCASRDPRDATPIRASRTIHADGTMVATRNGRTVTYDTATRTYRDHTGPVSSLAWNAVGAESCGHDVAGGYGACIAPMNHPTNDHVDASGHRFNGPRAARYGAPIGPVAPDTYTRTVPHPDGVNRHVARTVLTDDVWRFAASVYAVRTIANVDAYDACTDAETYDTYRDIVSALARNDVAPGVAHVAAIDPHTYYAMASAVIGTTTRYGIPVNTHPHRTDPYRVTMAAASVGDTIALVAGSPYIIADAGDYGDDVTVGDTYAVDTDDTIVGTVLNMWPGYDDGMVYVVIADRMDYAYTIATDVRTAITIR